MTSSTDYAGARTATLEAVRELYGEGGPEYDAVAAARTAVGVRRPPVPYRQA
jgi:Zn-dependent metalloprotease